ncbi:MAG: 50S ribosomal protein L10 [Acidimicrobiia bacterium]|jgi:large subunit ribosomal protein L10|nr:50S ribosomal protein L10 [Acidimicrobiia bacterium]
MDNPRSEKVAVVDEVRERLRNADAVLLTEYRGIDVTGMAALRRALRDAGGDYKIYKNTLVRLAAASVGMELDELLVGPTAIAFVPSDGDGDPVAVAKVLKTFAKENPNLVIKGGLLGTELLGPAEMSALADIAPREELLARLAGGLAAPMQQFAGLLQALPRNFAYGLAALIEQGGAPGAPAAPAAAEPISDEPDTSPSEDTPSEDTPTPADTADTTDDPADAGDQPTEES